MRHFRTIERVSYRKRRVLLGILTAISAGGCATTRNISESEYPQKPIVPRSSIASTTLLSGNQIQSGPAARDAVSPTVQTVGYNDGLVLAAPVSGNFQEEQGGLSEAVDGGEQATDRRNQADTAEDISTGDASTPESDNPTVVNSASASGTQHPVDYFVSVAMFGHPKLRAARERVAAASNVAPQVSSLPDPMFNNTFWPIQNQALQTAGGRVGHQFGLSQGVPWPEKLRTKAAIANREVQMAQAELERIEREITEAVRLAYYEVWFNTRAIEIIQETRELVDDLTQVAEARYKSGGSQQDVLRAQLEADRLDDQMVTLSRQKEQAQADLATLVQQPASLMPETSEQLGLSNVPQQLDGLLTLAEQCNPELRAIAWEIQRDRQKQKLACLQKYPDLQLGLNYAIISDDANVISPVANGHVKKIVFIVCMKRVLRQRSPGKMS